MADDVANVFQRQRESIAQKGVAAEQRSREAIKRRFAAIGNLNSGAGIKAEEEAARGVQEQVQSAQDQLAAPEAEFKFRAAEAERAGQQFEKNYGLQQQQQELAKQQFGLQKDVFGLEKESKLRQLDLAERTFKSEREDQAYNKALSALQAGYQFNLGDYLSSIGFDIQAFHAGDLARAKSEGRR